MNAAVNPRIRDYEVMQAMPSEESAASFAMSALVNVSGAKVSAEEAHSLICEVSRILNDMSKTGDLIGCGEVVDLLDAASDKASDIKPAVRTCRPCEGSGEGRHAGRCLVCRGNGEVAA